MEGDPEGGLRSHPAVRGYVTVALLALVVMVLALVEYGVGVWGLLPLLIGAVSVVAFWGFGPPLLLVSLAGLLFSHTRFRRLAPAGDWDGPLATPLADLTLCAAVLTYLVAQYRLLGLTRGIFPPDARARRPVGRVRSAGLVSSWEMTALAITVPTWVALAVATWLRLTEVRQRLGLPRHEWHAVLLAWAALLVLAAAAAAAGYVGRALAGPEESLLYLQDQAWRDTRREQGLLNRWLTWARLRAARRKEKSGGGDT